MTHQAILYVDRGDRRKSPGVPGAAITIFRPSSIHSDINAVCVSEEYIADVRYWFIANRFND